MTNLEAHSADEWALEVAPKQKCFKQGQYRNVCKNREHLREK